MKTITVALASASVCLLWALGFETHSQSVATSVPATVEFVDISAAAGIKFDITKLATGPKYLIETMGGGGGFIDYDRDGLLDIYLVCYSQTPQSNPATKLRDVLYRNNGDGTFSDVTERAGISNSMYGMGMTVGDYDNDGFPDIYITGYGASRLYRNNGNGTFTDATARARVNNSRWGASAAFFDYDNDGFLDLYVSNYLDYVPGGKYPCTEIEKRPYCIIDKFKGASPVLFRNNRDGTFTDVTEKAGVKNDGGKGLGVIALDYDNDGRMDIFQANDAAPNFLFRNNGDGTFSEVALEAEVALDPAGRARGGMGTDAEDIDANGYLDIFVANFSGETNALFRNDGDGRFTEATNELGLGVVSIPMSGFGSRFFDYNNDGLVDVFVHNGHPFEGIEKVFTNVTHREPPFLFENTGKGFRNVAAEHGAALKKSYAGRGLAVGDIDNDGDSDLLLLNVGEPPALLRNDGGNRNGWLGVKLIGTKANRDAVGAKVSLSVKGVKKWKQLLGGTSYCAASDMRLLFGMGRSDRVETLEVRWPSGHVTRLRDVKVNQHLTISESAGLVTSVRRD